MTGCPKMSATQQC